MNRVLIIGLLAACSVLTFLFVINMGRAGKIDRFLPSSKAAPGVPVYADIPQIGSKPWFSKQDGLAAFWAEVDSYAVTEAAKIETQLAKYNEVTAVLSNCGAEYQSSRRAYYTQNKDAFFAARRKNVAIMARGESTDTVEQTLKGLKAVQFSHSAKSLFTGDMEDAATSQNIIPNAKDAKTQRMLDLRQNLADPAFCPQVNMEAASGKLDIVLP